MGKAAFLAELRANVAGLQLVDGYAPFCKHLYVPNFVPGLEVGALEITLATEALLHSDYQARTPQELPVLVRYFPRGRVTVPQAEVLDVILYSRRQVEEEARAMPGSTSLVRSLGPELEDAQWDWAIISVKGQREAFELPMLPITMMRNALGKSEGGSGVPLDRAKYAESVAYWRTHAAVM